MEASTFDKCMMLLITGITNFAMVPAIIQLHHQRRPFLAFVGLFTMLTSFLYHCCDSIDDSLWLSEGKWHRLDNIGSIMSFVCFLEYLMDNRDEYRRRFCLYCAFGIVLVLQEKAPWDVRFTGFPILLALLCLLFKLKCMVTNEDFPKYDKTELYRGMTLLGIAVGCFIRGLDDATDPYRFFHGCWHFFIGVAAYFNFRILPHGKALILPTKST